jgi:hypothetical protein
MPSSFSRLKTSRSVLEISAALPRSVPITASSTSEPAVPCLEGMGRNAESLLFLGGGDISAFSFLEKNTLVMGVKAPWQAWYIRLQ